MARNAGVGRKPRLLWGVALLVTICLLLSGTVLYAHGGGIPRLTDAAAGPYRIFAWTQPEPLRVGEMHLSIGVVKAATDSVQSAEALDEAVTDATVMLYLLPVTADVPVISVPAVLQEQMGSYYYEADAALPTPGEWRFTIEVSGALGEGQAEFMSAVAPAREINWTLVAAAAVLLFFLLGLIGVWNRMQAKEMIRDTHKTI